MKITQNLIKGWITTALGTSIIILTCYLIYEGTFDFLWEGVGGITIGALLLISPKSIEKKVSELISNNKFNNSQNEEHHD